VFLTKVQPLVVQVYAALNSLDSYEVDGSGKAGRRFTATYHNARTAMITLLLVATLIGLALAVFVARLIVGPLRRVSTVLDRVAAGDLSQVAQAHAKDELGQMATSLNRAIARLRTTVGTMDHSARRSTAPPPNSTPPPVRSPAPRSSR